MKILKWENWWEIAEGPLQKFLATQLINIISTTEKEKKQTHSFVLVAHSASYSSENVTAWLPKGKASACVSYTCAYVDAYIQMYKTTT